MSLPFITETLRRGSAAAALLPILAAAGPAPVRAELADVILEPVHLELDEPVDVTHAGDSRLFVVELRGQVRIIDGGELLAEPFLDVSDRIPSSGHGLHSIAFHPRGGFVYLHRAERQTRDLLITRFRISETDPDRVDPASEVILLRVVKDRFRHYGGRLRFGPDGFLYASIGDDSDQSEGEVLIDPECASQSIDRFEGKMLRLDVDRNVDQEPYYGIPPGNPFDGTGRPEIWATGLRNPWRFSFDLETGDLWIGDVGEDEREEANLQPAASAGGENYGWKVMEGSACFGDTSGCGFAVPACNSPALTPPVLEYTHLGGNCSVTGGVVYRGSLIPDLYGHYLYGDFCSGTIWAAGHVDGAWTTQELSVKLPMLFSFAYDRDGEVVVSAQGGIYRLVDPTIPSAGIVEFAVTETEVTEDTRQVPISVRRVGEGVGDVQVAVLRAGGTAGGEDFPFDGAVLDWAAGETGTRTFTVPLIDDTLDEDDETVVLELDSAQGGVEIGARKTAVIRILDDDEPACMADANVLCLNGGRFRVSVSWRTDRDQTGLGRAVTLGEDSGSFWFFSSNNPEIFVKVLDACFEPFNHFWVFAAGLTDVETRLEVLDTTTGQVRIYDRALGRSYDPVRDTTAFPTCP